MKPRALTEEDIAYIKANFTYDPETGVVTRWGRWKERGRTGNDQGGGYLQFFHCNGRDLLAHRIAMVLMGEDVNGKQVDHINGHRADNRSINLRLVSTAVNARNAKRSKANTSGVTGVSWKTSTGKWVAFVKEMYVKKHLGVFDDFFEAVCARKSAEKHLGYHPNHGRR